MTSQDNGSEQSKTKSWKEEIEVAGEKLVEKIRELTADANVRRVRVKAPDGDIAVDIPLTVGALAGGVVVLAAPVLAVLGALAVFVTKIKIEIVYEEPAEATKDDADAESDAAEEPVA